MYVVDDDEAGDDDGEEKNYEREEFVLAGFPRQEPIHETYAGARTSLARRVSFGLCELDKWIE